MTKKQILKELEPYLDHDPIPWIVLNSWAANTLKDGTHLNHCANCQKKLGNSPLDGMFCNDTCRTVYWAYES